MASQQIQVNTENPDNKIRKIQSEIESWGKKVESLFNEKKQIKTPESQKEIEELTSLNQFIKGRLTKRLLLLNNLSNEDKITHFKFLEPHYGNENLTRFNTQYFDVEVFKQVRLKMRQKKEFEREVSILFDLYKVKKTIETINTIEGKLQGKDVFPSMFSVEERKEYLNVLKEMLKLFFIKFVKPEYLKEVFQTLSEKKLDTDVLLAMHKEGKSYIKPEILTGIEYRNKFIMLIFATQLRTVSNKKTEDFQFNYLHFEMIKNDFLTHWMQSKLKGNPDKDKIFQSYRIGGKTIAQLVAEDPEKEAEILKSLPNEAFNDIAEQINNKVEEALKSPVSTFSKNHGLFSRLQSSFTEIKKIARFSSEKMHQVARNTQIWTVREKTKSANKVIETPKFIEKAIIGQASKIDISLEVLAQKDLDFVFFDMNRDAYQQKLQFFAKKLGTRYLPFTKGIWNLFNAVSPQQIIMQQEPSQEWVIPLHFKQKDQEQLLILGFEISAKDQGKQRSKFKEDTYTLNAFYIFGCLNPIDKLGISKNKRMVKEQAFSIYNSSEVEVQKIVIELFNKLLKSKKEDIFSASNLNYREPKEVFEALEALKKLPGLGFSPNQPPQETQAQPTLNSSQAVQKSENKAAIGKSFPEKDQPSENIMDGDVTLKNKKTIEAVMPPSGKANTI
ncbi:MAG: hypothetical protein HOD92_00925 [Deltaproteobacteria bacterium]|jgi:hypothetical protein|nr:hypothetical protein [Deltaproteobacteria bacterium]